MWRRRVRCWVVSGISGLLLAAPAAQSLPYTGQVQVQLGPLAGGTLSALPGGSGSGSGGGFMNVTGSLGGTVTLVNGPTPNGGTFTGLPPSLPAIQYQATFGGATCPSFPCVSALGGWVKVGLFGPPQNILVNLSVPLVVAGATTGATTMFANVPFNLFVTATNLGPWTPGMATITTTDTLSMVNQNFATGSDARTPGGVGQIALVSPVLVKTNQGSIPQLALFSIVILNFTPEPGTLLLLGSGVAGLAMLGRRQMRGLTRSRDDSS